MRIWLAEDEAPQRAQLCALLRQVCAARGIEADIRAFESGQALVDAYESGVDLLLLDIDMPGLSGMDAAHRIRERDERVLIAGRIRRRRAGFSGQADYLGQAG